jgi:hypothetical protein
MLNGTGAIRHLLMRCHDDLLWHHGDLVCRVTRDVVNLTDGIWSGDGRRDTSRVRTATWHLLAVNGQRLTRGGEMRGVNTRMIGMDVSAISSGRDASIGHRGLEMLAHIGHGTKAVISHVGENAYNVGMQTGDWVVVGMIGLVRDAGVGEVVLTSKGRAGGGSGVVVKVVEARSRGGCGAVVNVG